MRDTKELLRVPNEELDYQPEPDTIAGFISSMSDRVNELLIASNWRPSLE